MKVVLIDPLMEYRAHCVSETLGLMYIAAVLREAGHGVQIIATGLREDAKLTPSDIMDADLVGVTATSALFGIVTVWLFFLMSASESIVGFIDLLR